jgi:hypothetical protein
MTASNLLLLVYGLPSLSLLCSVFTKIKSVLHLYIAIQTYWPGYPVYLVQKGTLSRSLNGIQGWTPML